MSTCCRIFSWCRQIGEMLRNKESTDVLPFLHSFRNFIVYVVYLNYELDLISPGTKKSTPLSTFEHSLVPSKNRTISSTNWENQHYFETSSAPTLKMRTFFNHCSNFECWKRLPWSLFEVSLPRQVRLEVNTDHDCKSRWHFGAGLAICAAILKRACTLLSIHLMVKSCNTFGVATSPNVAALSTSFNPVENWLHNDMIGRTGMEDSFNVSLSASFIRKKRTSLLPDEARTERNVETVYHDSRPTNQVTSLNGMNLNMWSCPSSSFGIWFVGFQEH